MVDARTRVRSFLVVLLFSLAAASPSESEGAPAGRVLAWGKNDYLQVKVPEGLTNAISIAGGLAHSVAARNDGTVVAWGGNLWGERDVPPGLNDAVAVAAGTYHSMALRSNGTVMVWGSDNFGQRSTMP